MTMPLSTSTSSAPASKRSTRCIFSVDITRPPSRGTDPPENPDPAPRGTTAIPRREASRTSLARSSRFRGKRDAPGASPRARRVETVREQIARLRVHRHAAQRARERLYFPASIAGHSLRRTLRPRCEALTMHYYARQLEYFFTKFSNRSRARLISFSEAAKEKRIILSQPNAPPGMTTSPCSARSLSQNPKLSFTLHFL